MKPGRELDALVAEKGMGLTLKKLNGNTYWVDRDGQEPEFSCEFSTDISAAWEVMEKMKMHEPNISWTDEGHKWICSFDKQPANIIGTGESASHAICLAALKVVGNE